MPFWERIPEWFLKLFLYTLRTLSILKSAQVPTVLDVWIKSKKFFWNQNWEDPIIFQPNMGGRFLGQHWVQK